MALVLVACDDSDTRAGDASVADAAVHDAGGDAAVDAGEDAGTDAGEPATPCTRAAEVVEGEPIAEASIFAADGSMHACFRETTPAYELWSDGLVATRWLYLPPGTHIDGTELEHFEFPVGTRALKRYAT